jgi:hypothetical protein
MSDYISGDRRKQKAAILWQGRISGLFFLALNTDMGGIW